jgi:NAD(P)H dehydrogenase (quinone)
MNVFIVHAHHEPKSFNGALKDLAIRVLRERNHQVQVSDLYAMRFDPVSDRRNFRLQKEPGYLKQQVEELHASETGSFAPDLQAELDKLDWCHCLIFQFPLWWFGLPAILKGWVDRVFAMGKVYGMGKWYDNGVFAGKRAMLSVTTGGPASIYGPDGLNGDLNEILFPINHGILRFTGFDILPPFVAWAPARIGEEVRRQYLGEYRRRLDNLETASPIPYPSLADFDPKTFTRKRP